MIEFKEFTGHGKKEMMRIKLETNERYKISVLSQKRSNWEHFVKFLIGN